MKSINTLVLKVPVVGEIYRGTEEYGNNFLARVIKTENNIVICRLTEGNLLEDNFDSSYGLDYFKLLFDNIPTCIASTLF